MKIDGNTLYSIFQPSERFLKAGECERLKEAAQRHFYPLNGFWDMSLSDFFACCRGDLSCFGIDFSEPERTTVFQIYAANAFSSFVTDFCDTVERLGVPGTIEEQQAQEACLKVSFEEGIIMFVREFFGLPSFSQAYTLTLFDYLMARKQTYNKEVCQRRMNDIMNKKLKTKN